MHSNLKKTLVSSAVTGALLVGTAGFSTAQAELSFNVGVFSDYLLDGASASDNNAVVQGGVDWEDPSGFYVGTWMSTLNDGEGQEVDLYLGYGFEAGGLDFDLGYIYYYYPEGDEADYGELYGSVGFGPVYFGLDYTLNADDSSAEGDLIYRLGAGFEVVPSISLDGELGYFDPDASDGDSFTFWTLGVTKATTMGDLSFTYGSTDESGSQDLFVVGYSLSF